MDGENQETTGPGPVIWARSALAIASDLPPELQAPESVWTALGADGTRLEAVVWGDGGQRSPYAVSVRGGVGPDGRSRYPTLEEVYAFFVALCKPGAIFMLEPFTVTTQGLELQEETRSSGRWCNIAVNQVGAVPGSEAAEGLLLIRPRGQPPEGKLPAGYLGGKNDPTRN